VSWLLGRVRRGPEWGPASVRPKRRTRAAVLCAAAVSVCLAVLGGCSGGQEPEGRSSRDAPDFRLTTLEGREIRLSDYRGKVVLLSFWATWCKPCKEAMPHERAMQERFEPRGFTVLGLSLDRDRGELAGFLEKEPLNYPVVQVDDATREAFGGVPTIPLMILVDRKGRIRQKKVGFTPASAESLEKTIEYLLTEGEASIPYGS